MTLELIINPDSRQADVYTIARAVYAETGASSLAAIEAMCSMISNVARKTSRTMLDVACDENIMYVQNKTSPRHERLNDTVENRGFQMCLRVVRRMICGGLCDTVRGAVRFHHSDEMPDWATSRGYIADIDGLLFYL